MRRKLVSRAGLVIGIKGILLGNDAKGNYSTHEEGHTGSFFMMGKNVKYTIEVLQDHRQGVHGK